MACINKEEKLKIVYGDLTLGVHGENFSYLFSYGAGGMESLVVDGMEWLYRVPKPAFWRALIDNDRGNQFQLRAGMWLSADQFIRCLKFEVSLEGKPVELPVAPHNNSFTGKETATRIGITYTYETITVPATQVTVAYEVTAGGRIEVKVHYNGKKELPELPVFGMRFVMPTKATFYQYEGLSGETYPDRMAGGVPGIYEVEGLPIPAYIVPQDCGVHMETKWLSVYRDKTQSNIKRGPLARGENSCGLTFKAVDKNFAFSCIPYTPQELESATHMEELPPARRTVVSILGAVRGVGGINSWGAQTEEPYRIDASKDIEYTFAIEPAR